MPIPRVLRTLTGYGIFDRGTMNFSRDGSHLLVSSAPLEEIATLQKDPAPPVPVPCDKKVQAGLWSWRDDYVQPMQKARVVDSATGSRRPAVVPGPGAIPASHQSPAQPEGIQRPPATVLRSFPQRGVEPEWMARGIPYIDRGQEKERFNSAVYDSEEKKEVKK